MFFQGLQYFRVDYYVHSLLISSFLFSFRRTSDDADFLGNVLISIREGSIIISCA